MSARVRVTLSRGAFEALGLDDSVMQRERGLTVTHKNAWREIVEGAPAEIALVLDDVLDRSKPFAEGSGFDQPQRYRRACKTAWPRIVAEVEAQDYTVMVKPPFGSVTISPK